VDVLSRRVEPINLQLEPLDSLNIIAKITFGGDLEVRSQAEKADYKGNLFRAYSGDLIYSKIRVAQGSLTLIPDHLGRIAVSNEYPVYALRSERLMPGYLELVCRTKVFRNLLQNFASGNTTKMRIRPGEFEDLEIPHPPLDTQRAIVARWQAAQAETAYLEQRALTVEAQSWQTFDEAIGIQSLSSSQKPRAFALWWSESDRWSVEANQLRKLGHRETPRASYSILPISEIGQVTYGLQVCPERRPRDYPTPYLRVANVQRGYVDLSKIKELEVPPQELSKYQLEQGDILLCEGNSADLVGRGAIWRGEIENCVHQNHVLRVRLDGTRALPEYVMAYINSDSGRAYFRSKAKRTTNLASINSQEVARMPLPLPPLAIQRDIVRQVEAGRAEAARLREQATERARAARAEVEAALLGREIA
jgi:type I restriction enzyme S subunit